jgi:hypothetical protein
LDGRADWGAASGSVWSNYGKSFNFLALEYAVKNRSVAGFTQTKSVYS